MKPPIAVVPQRAASEPAAAILRRGIWSQNPTTVHLLGLCPLLAVTTTLHSGLVLGLASAVTVSAASLITSLLRRRLDASIRLPACVVIIAAIVGCIDLWLEAFFHQTHRTLGLFIPLIVTNCAIAARAESFAAKNPPLPALTDGIACGTGITLALCAVGALRELLHSGGLSLTGAVTGQPLLLIAILPVGAFFSLALLIAAQRALSPHPPETSRSNR